ncbi:MAG: glycosyltransferase family 4 protein [Planctomycetota bacterium]
MRILLYTETALPRVGGQELVVDALARSFVAAGHTVQVLAPWSRFSHGLDPAAMPYEVAWHPRFVSTRHFVSQYANWLSLAQRRGQFDVVHCHSTYPNGYVASCCQALSALPMLVTSHGQDVGPGSLAERKPRLVPRYGAALRRADGWIAIGRFTEEKYLELARRSAEGRSDPLANPFLVNAKIRRLPNGVFCEECTRPAARPKEVPAALRPHGYLLFLGRLVERKGVDILLRALALLHAKHRLPLAIAGEGPARAELQSLASALGIASGVHFVGRVAGEAKRWLLQHSLFTVLPSRGWEAFPLVVLESCAAGRPVLATRIPCLDDAVQPGQNGWLVEPELPAALASELRGLLSNREGVEQMACRARAWCAPFDWRHIAERHLELYEELLARRWRSAAA